MRWLVADGLDLSQLVLVPAKTPVFYIIIRYISMLKNAARILASHTRLRRERRCSMAETPQPPTAWFIFVGNPEAAARSCFRVTTEVVPI